MEANVWIVFLAGLITAIFTGLGALPFVFARQFSRFWLGVANAAAGGLMIGASINLIVEGARLSLDGLLLGLLLGLLAIWLADRIIAARGEPDVADLQGAGARKALLVLAVMTAHSFAEGVGVGVAFGDTPKLGEVITTAIALHNIPEGLAISLVLVPRGAPVWKAAGWSIFTSLPQPLMAVPAFLFVLAFKPLLPIGLGIAAGAMFWMVVSEILPDAYEDVSPSTAGLTVMLSMIALWSFQHFVLGHW